MLPLCVGLDADNRLVALGEYSADCAGYVLQTPADFAGSMTIAGLFGFPDPVAFGLAFSAAFGLVLFLAAVASTVGEVSGFFSSTTQVEEL
ncbi:hypothetical protein [Pseudomonas syringae]|uniref:hypothetical protein n=1 Tax=Pseudomonas syringae TaxID=317 RepID=UPI000941F9F8|nr:hypothetical protein [Pseudomonas syringae]